MVEGWVKLSYGWTYREAAAVGVDSKDNVYVFSREHPIIVYVADRENHLESPREVRTLQKLARVD